MNKLQTILSAFLFVAAVSGCTKPREWPVIPTTPEQGQEQPGTQNPEPTVPEDKYGIAYLYGDDVIPEIHIEIPDDQLQELLSAYDKDKDTKHQVRSNITYVKGDERTTITEAAIRLKGNTSRRRPVDGSGKWHHTHWQINFHKFVKDDAHEIHGAQKIVLKWFNSDPAYVREAFCYDLFRRAGVWTAVNNHYVRLWIKKSSDTKECYLGVYDMIEPIDSDYLKVRKEQFGDSKGYLWKCRYNADLRDKSRSVGADLDDGKEYVYELKTQTSKLEDAKVLLYDFIDNLNARSGTALLTWMQKHCDLQLLMKTYAVNVAVGMWDDYWNNCNNYYLYFSGSSVDDYKVWFIPYDYDNSLGTCMNCGVQSDSGRQSPLKWGDSSKNPLIGKLLESASCRKMYCDELIRLITPGEKLMDAASSAERIKAWQNSIRDFVKNDTGEDMVVEDKPAPWGNHSEYRLLGSSNNFFTIKAETINRNCK